MPGSVGAVAAAKNKKRSGSDHLEKAFEKADISQDGKVSFRHISSLLKFFNQLLLKINLEEYIKMLKVRGAFTNLKQVNDNCWH